MNSVVNRSYCLGSDTFEITAHVQTKPPLSQSPTHLPAAMAHSLAEDQETISSEGPERPQGSQSIAAYASAVENGSRIPRSCDSIDDMGMWHVDPDGFINEARRAGGPSLCSLPLSIEAERRNDPVESIFENYVLLKNVISTLSQYDVYTISFKVKKCIWDFADTLIYVPTLMITAFRDNFDDSWVLACRQIWKHLSDAGHGNVNVEIADPSLHAFHQIIPLQPIDPLWPFKKELERRILREIDLTDVNSISMTRISYDYNREKMPLAVVITIHYQSIQDWRHARDQIVDMLDQCNLPMVEVIIVKDWKLWRGKDDPQNWRSLDHIEVNPRQRR